ncbi:DUF1749 domain-containing protein [uncultured Polaribacter sp.]|uniref:alpha/beta hydrolase n=1 Tax=uncultured Polaribacter sp. TaxID=174711 RepID=UPI00260283A7|nr:DUF1749 domain-containing protein [uncultured Polaribacter sp.]
MFLLLYNVSIAQTLYLDSVSKVSKKTYTYKKYNDKKLKLDFYKPKKIKKNLPLIIYVHGGGFAGGKRDVNHIVDFANNLAKRGYAVASVSYRLTMQKLGFGCNTKASEKIKAFNNASEDISFAINYILENNRKFKINKTKIILLGSSAGAEAILNLAYIYDQKILSEKFKFAGLISMAGATISQEKINKQNAIPTLLFHGIKDKLVPYNIAPHHYCKKNDVGYLILYGSRAIADRLKVLNKPYFLYTIKEGNHGWCVRPLYECSKEILDFMYFDVLKNKKRQTEISI